MWCYLILFVLEALLLRANWHRPTECFSVLPAERTSAKRVKRPTGRRAEWRASQADGCLCRRLRLTNRGALAQLGER